jgi:3-hydroxyacyl-CoA dehydrogenase
LKKENPTGTKPNKAKTIMTNLDKIQHVAVLGAAGKMGSGILYLNTLYLSQLALKPENCNRTFTIHAIDQSHERLQTLMLYIKGLLQKWAEKNIVALRAMFAERNDLIENSEIIQAYIDTALALIVPSTRLESAYDATLIFEAVIENVEVKTELFSKIKANNPLNPWFLTNTSSIPIDELNTKAKLDGNIIGCHFYNPPAVQKLIEVIELNDGNKQLSEYVYQFGKELGKVMVPANDIAGFIGNGFFMRDLLFGIEKLKQFKGKFSFSESVLLVDTLTRDFMLRPMGIFQLMDYVGIDVCSFILKVMNNYLSENLHSELLISLMEKHVMGGQNADGSQKPGFFTYQRGRIETVYNFDKSMYEPVEELLPKVQDFLGELPENQSWRSISRSKDKAEVLSAFFSKMAQCKSTGCQLGMEYMQEMKRIGKNLVAQGVTNSDEHVNTVMITGFHHLYGPINEYC